MPATAVRERIPFALEHPPGAELKGAVEHLGKCRCCKLELNRVEVNPDYLDSLAPAYSDGFKKLCAVSKSGRHFFPRLCATCERRGESAENGA